jgi:hypothetical protein
LDYPITADSRNGLCELLGPDCSCSVLRWRPREELVKSARGIKIK